MAVIACHAFACNTRRERDWSLEVTFCVFESENVSDKEQWKNKVNSKTVSAQQVALIHNK